MAERIRRPVVWFVIVSGIGFALTASLRSAHASSPTPQLPNLVADPPDNISLGISEESPTHEHISPRLLLRFNGYVHNSGAGALDIRGTRSAPTNPEDLASPPMTVYQRIYEYETTEGPPPTSESTPHKDQQIGAKMEYVSADGHEHWHLQHVDYYSLWNQDKSAEVAPAQKVGFCLEDSEHIEYNKGPTEQVYKDYGEHPREFCRQKQPEATEVFEGVSAGWRDLYTSNLAFQWVDVSDVLPGEYWLREEVNPEHTISEQGTGAKVAYASQPAIVPGFDALAQSPGTEVNRPVALELGATTWGKPEATPEYEIVSLPAHGTLTPLQENRTTYTPETGYTGADSFTFSARDPSSLFPLHPAIATVAISVTPVPTVAIEGAPASMIAGTSVQLSSTVANDVPTVIWSANSGSITPTGLYTAPSVPPSGGVATVAVQTAKGPRDERRIEIVPVPAPKPAPEVPGPPVVPSNAPPLKGPLSTPTAMLIGRKLYLTVKTSKTGLLRIGAFVRRRAIGGCTRRLRGGMSFTCAFALPRWVSTRSPISVSATLRVGRHLLHTSRSAARVPTAMKAAKASHSISLLEFAHAAAFFCGM
jgi:hypothetical protein